MAEGLNLTAAHTLPRRRLLGWLAGLGAAAALGPQRVAAAAAAATRVVVLSDFNGRYGNTDYLESVDAAVQRTIALRPELVISTGDMVAGQRLQPLLTRPEIGVCAWP